MFETHDLSLDDFEQIDEKKIRNYAITNPSRTVDKLLQVAEDWRQAGCTPVFIVAQEEPLIIACVAEERFGRPYS